MFQSNGSLDSLSFYLLFIIIGVLEKWLKLSSSSKGPHACRIHYGLENS